MRLLFICASRFLSHFSSISLDRQTSLSLLNSSHSTSSSSLLISLHISQVWSLFKPLIIHFMHSDLDFGICWKIWGFSKSKRFLQNFWDGLCENFSCMIVVCLLCWTDYVLVGLDWAKPILFLLLHITCSCIFMHTYLTFSIFLYIDCIWCFSVCFSLPLSLSCLR